jgi:hypothetical protein
MTKPKTRRTATLPDGSTTSRLTAAERAYIVITRLSYEYHLAEASPLYDIDGAVYRDYCAEIDGTSVFQNKRPGWSDEEHAAIVAARKAWSTKAIKGIASAHEYQMRCRAKRVADVERRKANGLYDRWNVKSWFSCMDRAREAADAPRSPRIAEVQIIHTD